MQDMTVLRKMKDGFERQLMKRMTIINNFSIETTFLMTVYEVYKGA